jgi:hypothetical protein
MSRIRSVARNLRLIFPRKIVDLINDRMVEVEIETGDVWMRPNPAIIESLKEVNLPTENRGDNVFALARKTSAPIERYPKELYVD